MSSPRPATAALLRKPCNSRKSGKGTLLMVGAHDRARYLAKSLVEGGVSVLLVDRDSTKVAGAQEEGLQAICFDVLSSDMDEYLDFTDIGAMLAVLRNDEVNTLAVLKFRHELGAANVFRILSERGSHAEAGRAFGGLTRAELDRSWDQGYRPRVVEMGNDTEEIRALVVLDEKGDWDVVDGKRKLTPGDRVVALAHECWDPV